MGIQFFAVYDRETREVTGTGICDAGTIDKQVPNPRQKGVATRSDRSSTPAAALFVDDAGAVRVRQTGEEA